MSGLALVLDATDHTLSLVDVATEFSRAGLTRPFVWLTAHPTSPRYTFVTLPLDDDQEPPDLTLNETINRLAPAEAIRLHVIIDGLVPPDPSPIFDAIREVRHNLEIDFGQRVPLATSLLVLPPSDADALPPDASSIDGTHIASLGEWKHIFVVSREDSPSPSSGNQLRNEFASVVIHSLLGIDGMWRGGTLADDVYDQLEGLGGKPRMVRGWTRLVDGGFVADHIAASLARVTIESRTPLRVVLENAQAKLLAEPAVAGLLGSHPPHERPSAPLTGLAYIVAFVPFFMKKCVGVAWRLLLERLLGPVVRRIQRTIDRIAVRLGAPREPRKSTAVTDPWASLRDQVRQEIQIIDEGKDADMSADTAADFWRPVTTAMVGYVDRCELPAADVVGPTAMSGDTTLADALANALLRAITDTRSVIEAHCTMLGSPVADVEQSTPQRRWRRIGRWFRRKWAWFLIFIGLALLVTGLVAPGLGLILVGVVSFAGTWLLAAGNAVLQRVITLFRQHNERGLDDYQIAENLSYYARHWALLHHRRSQLDSWITVLRVLFAGVGAGSPIPQDRQCDFLPAQTPDSLVLATGVCSAGHIEQLALGLRQSTAGDSLFLEALHTLLEFHPKALDDPTRFGLLGGMRTLRTECVGGLRPEVRDLARTLVDRFIQQSNPTLLLEGAVEWVRKIDRFGRRYWTPAEGVSPIGPAGRAVATEATRPQIELAGVVTTRCSVVLDPATPLVGVFIEGNRDRVLTYGPAPHATLPPGNNLAEREMPSPTDCLPIALGGLGGLRPGRPVMTVEMLSGSLQPRLATVQEIRRDGSFTIDVDVPRGAPVVDVESRTLVGVITSCAPTVAAGPLLLRDALAGGAELRASSSQDLDPSFRIPRDVALMAPLGGDPIAVVPSELPPNSVPVDTFLSVALEPSSNNFVRRVAIDPGLLRVSQRIPDSTRSSRTAWLGLDGRLMLSAHSLEFSNEFDLDNLTFIERSTATPQTTNGVEI